MKGFESFVVELKESIDVCVKRNIHDRTKEEIELVNNLQLISVHLVQYN